MSKIQAQGGALSIRKVSKIYDPDGLGVRALDACSLDIGAGEICMVLGPSGCGKTTLLNAVAGFHGISGGEINLDGKVLCDSRNPHAKPGTDRMVVFQSGALFPWKTLLDNVAYGPIVQKRLSPAVAWEKALDMLTEAGLGEVARKYPGEVSSGMARRAEIVRALINDPKILLLDEPYRAMDTLTKSIMHENLLRMHALRPVTVFFITHDLEEAVFLGRRVAVMTSRPATIKEIIDIDLPYPRDHRVLSSEAFRRLVKRVKASVHAEAEKAFAAGDKELA